MSESSREEKNAALLVASLASFLAPFMSSSINVALPVISTAFKADTVLTTWIATSYLLGSAVFLIPFGRAGDILGRKKIFLYGIILFTVASFLCGLANTTNILILFRVFQSIGSAMIFGTGMAILTSVFPLNERGRAMGIAVGATYTGLTLGPFAGGLLIKYLGWRSVFFSMVPLGIIAVYFVIKKLKKEWSDAKGEKFDWAGSLLYAVSLILIMYSFSLLPEFRGVIYLLSGLIIFVLFVVYQLRIPFPVFELTLFQNNITFRFSNLAALINYSGTFATSFLLSFYFQKIRGIDARETGMILVSSPFIMAILSPSVGKLSDRIEPRILASIGMAISSLGLFLFFFISDETKIFMMVLLLLFMGLGFAFFSSPNTNAVMSSVEKKYLGIASGSLGTMRMIGQMFSMGIAMMLFSLFIGKTEINPSNLVQLLKAIKVTFGVNSILCFIGIFASLARGKIRT